MTEIQLGDTVQCKYSGIKGTAMAKTEFINGCTQYEILPKSKENEIREAICVDEQSLKVIKKATKERKKKTTGGNMRPAINRFNY